MVKPLEVKTDNTILASTDENTSKKKSVSYWGEKPSSSRVYLQESNNPTKYIKLSREMFLKMTDKIATWKF